MKILFSFIFLGTLVSNVFVSPYTDQLQKQLNQCRAEYQQMVRDAQNKIDTAIAERRAPRVHLESWKEQLQQQINFKATQCKKIKQELRDAPAKELAMAQKKLKSRLKEKDKSRLQQ